MYTVKVEQGWLKLEIYLQNSFLQKHIALVYFIKTVWDYVFLKTYKEKQSKNFTYSKLIVCNTLFWAQDVCQVNISGD